MQPGTGGNEKTVRVVIENINRDIIEDPTGAAREARLSAAAEERAMYRAQAVPRVGMERAAGAGYVEGAGPVGARLKNEELEAISRRDVMLEQKRADVMVTQRQSMENQRFSNSILQVNMSLLGLMFGFQNIINLMNIQKDAELQQLQMKENKTKADKERIKQLREEQIEQQKLNKIMMGSISIVQLLASLIQILNVVRVQSSATAQQEAQASLQAAGAKTVEGNAAMYDASANTASWIAKWGPLGFVVGAMILTTIAAAIGAFTMWKAQGAAQGADIPGGYGDTLIKVGDTRFREFVTPEPMLRTIIHEQVIQANRDGGGGGGGIYVSTMDAQSFIEREAEIREVVRKAGYA